MTGLQRSFLWVILRSLRLVLELLCQEWTKDEYVKRITTSEREVTIRDPEALSADSGIEKPSSRINLCKRLKEFV